MVELSEYEWCFEKEWVWVYGYYVKALIEMNKIMPMRSKHKIMSYLANHKQFIKET